MSLTLVYTPDSCLQSEEEISRGRERKEVSFRSLQACENMVLQEKTIMFIFCTCLMLLYDSLYDSLVTAYLSHAVVCRDAMVTTSLNVTGHDIISDLESFL